MIHIIMELIKVLPYLFVLIGAIFGVNVFLLLDGGVIFAGVVGITTGALDFWGCVQYQKECQDV